MAADAAPMHGEETPELINMTFIDKDGKKQYLQVPIGKNVLEICMDNNLDLEGGPEWVQPCSWVPASGMGELHIGP